MKEIARQKFKSYPKEQRRQLKIIRQLILKTAEQCDAGPVSEVLKWNELSYVTKIGSTIRLGCRPDQPSKYYVYFHCQTRLIETFRELYGQSFQFEGKRAMVFDLADQFPNKEFKHCIAIALRYHKVKHLPLLGA